MKPSRKEIRWLLNDKYGGVETSEFKKDLERLEKGEPVDYVIGWVPFLDARIDLKYRPLIPRLETEYWTEKAIQDMRSLGLNKVKVLDMFSGSGNIGIAVMLHVPESEVVFAEKSKRAIKGIALSCELNGVSPERYDIIESDVFSEISGTFDFIMANPPYVGEENSEQVGESVMMYEPRMAVFSGKRGDGIIKRFLAEVQGYLNKGGRVYMEFDSFQKEMIESLLKDSDLSSFEIYKDQFDRWRYCVATK